MKILRKIIYRFSKEEKEGLKELGKRADKAFDENLVLKRTLDGFLKDKEISKEKKLEIIDRIGSRYYTIMFDEIIWLGIDDADL